MYACLSFLAVLLPEWVSNAAGPDLESFGSAVLSDQVMAWVSDAERNPPYLRGAGFDTWGRPNNDLVTSEGWRHLQEMGFREG